MLDSPAPLARGAFPLLDRGNCPGNFSSVSPIIYFASLGQSPITKMSRFLQESFLSE